MSGNAPEPARQQRFDRLVAERRDDLYRYAVWLSRDPTLADDLVQEAMLRAWNSLDGLREDEAAKPWLLTIVRREWARAFERRRIETQDIDALSAAESALLATVDDPSLHDLRRAIFRLEDDYREPLVLQVMLGYSTKEIATLMGLTQAAVLTRLHRARKRLLERLDSAVTPDE